LGNSFLEEQTHIAFVLSAFGQAAPLHELLQRPFLENIDLEVVVVVKRKGKCRGGYLYTPPARPKP
jgi:hypothetical protein